MVSVMSGIPRTLSCPAADHPGLLGIEMNKGASWARELLPTKYS